MYCGNACKVAAWKIRHGRTPHHITREIRAIRLMPGLVAAADRRIRSIRMKIETLRRRRDHACNGCSAPLCGDNLKVRLCLACAVARRKAGKRISRTVGKARLRVATVEAFDPIEVLERDRWRCHLCGASTPKRLRGSYNDRAPELDHIIPLSVGGEHSRRNTACACRKCNIAKAGRPLGQLRLVA